MTFSRGVVWTIIGVGLVTSLVILLGQRDEYEEGTFTPEEVLLHNGEFDKQLVRIRGVISNVGTLNPVATPTEGGSLPRLPWPGFKTKIGEIRIVTGENAYPYSDEDGTLMFSLTSRRQRTVEGVYHAGQFRRVKNAEGKWVEGDYIVGANLVLEKAI